MVKILIFYFQDYEAYNLKYITKGDYFKYITQGDYFKYTSQGDYFKYKP